ncbi:uncharacterized protein FIESC28_03991 [Fusarium coffeatum]|uniref:Uncharacterized protein n=1 Tax=Fusarium coffeatum TaxID=231269 RepID=A0A366S1P9_9HYPO|nr:uncharacterized protein FIESC28_03991 [Fusarium coffeatum]RBR23249.1 hypothetical protein FIESC28_03991 [Fusarium coffeatum]
MVFFPSGRQHYHEPLPLRRPTFIDNPSSFSQCKRSHRPSPLDLADVDTEAKAKLPVVNSQLSSHTFWVQLLAECGDVSPLSSPIERRSLDVDRQLDSEAQPSEQGYILVSPLSVLGSPEPTFCVSPLDENDTAHTDALGEYEFVLASASTESEGWSVIAQPSSEDPMSAGGVSLWSNPFSDEYEDNSLDSPVSPSLEPSLEELNSMSPDNFSLDEPFVSAQEEFGPSSNPFSPNYEYAPSPDISPVHGWTIVTQDWSPVPEQGAVGHFSDDSSDDGLEIQHVRQRMPHPLVATPEVPTTDDGVNTVGYVAYSPRPFLTRSAGGGYGYITDATLPASRYGTFGTEDPSTPRSPWVDESETSMLLRAHTMDEHLDGGCSAWDDVFFIIMSLLFFAVSSIYVFILLSVLQHMVPKP